VFLIVEGKVKVSRLRGGDQSVVDIYERDEFFGESALLDLPCRLEEATALESTKVMSWPAAEIRDIILKKPRLGLALTQILARRTMDMTRRIQSFAVDNIPRRLARLLIRYADRMGKPAGNGFLSIPPLTHELLGQMVGTSREVITVCMTTFRERGHVQYSRRGIVLHSESLQGWLG